MEQDELSERVSRTGKRGADYINGLTESFQAEYPAVYARLVHILGGDIEDEAASYCNIGSACLRLGNMDRAHESYAYGLREAAQFQDLLRYARPQALIYWQFTEDYGLVHVGADGAIEPTSRFWLMKQFVNLSPTKSQVVRSSSDRPNVQISAFARKDELVVHILNTGPDCEARVSGLPAGPWRTVTTTEASGFQEGRVTVDAGEAPQGIPLPARSLTTLVRAPAAP